MMTSRSYQTWPAESKRYANTNNGTLFFSQSTPVNYPYLENNQMHNLIGFLSPNAKVTSDVPMVINKPFERIHTLKTTNQIETNKYTSNGMLFFLNSKNASQTNTSQPNRFVCGICHCVLNTLFELHEHMTMHKGNAFTNRNVSKCQTAISNTKRGNRSIHNHQLSLTDEHLLLSPSKTLEKTVQNVTHSLQVCNISEEIRPPKLRCKICYILFDNRRDLEAHQKIHRKICKVCKDIFPSIDELDSHCFKRHELPCELCDEIFQTLDQLNEHKLKCEKEDDKENDVKEVCEICCQKFSSETDLDEHFLVHGEARKYTCKVCNLIFRNKSLYNIHYDHHIKCPQCPKRFLKRTELQGHRLRKHMKWRKGSHIKCIVCEKKFIYRRQYVYHLKIHTGEDTLLSKKKEGNTKSKEQELYTCNQCQAKFSSRQLMKEHRVAHFEKHKCAFPSCEKTFMNKTDLVSHIGIHEGHKFICDQCDKVFSSCKKLQKHKNLVHNKLYIVICEVCGKKCTNRRAFKAHRLTHELIKNIICEKCGKMFKSNKMLSFHLKSHEKAYKCDVCGERFSRADNMKLHQRKHTKEKPYKCYYCHKTFSRKDNMNTHIKSHTHGRQ